jgi:hypothetical protein
MVGAVGISGLLGFAGWECNALSAYQSEEQEEVWPMDRRLFLGSALAACAGGAMAGVTGARAQTTAAPPPPAAPPAAMTPPAATPPAAAPPPPTRIRGSIASVEGNTMTVNSRDGTKLTVTLNDPLTVATVTKVPLSSIKETDFIGTATRTDAAGKLIALEVLVFPEAMRGTGEGFYPWDLQAGSMMTNGTVKGAVKAAKGRELTVAYKDKSNTIEVPPNAPVVTFAPATKDDLKKGAKIFAVSPANADGTLKVSRVTVGTHGVAPPM